MKSPWVLAVVSVVTVGLVVPLRSQTQPAGSMGTDVYHVNFSKAVPGQAVALGTALSAPDQSAPMPDHLLVLPTRRETTGTMW